MRTLHVVFAGLVFAGCTGSGEVRYSADATVTAPPLVDVEPGVQVVADYDQPVFFNGGVYWRYEGGVWYRSPRHDRGWVRVEAPPVALRHIDRPERYVHYRAQVRADERVEHRDNREIRHEQGEVRHDEHAEDHERHEIRNDERRGDEHAEHHDQGELRHDEKAEQHDQHELRNDQHKRAKDEHKEQHDEHQAR